MAEGVVRRVLTNAVTVSKTLKRTALKSVHSDVSATAESAASLLNTNIGQIEPQKIQVTTKSLKDLPGPTGYPILGTAPVYFRKENRGKMHEVQTDFHKKYGKIFKEKLGNVTNVSIADPKLVEDLVRSEGKYPFRPPYQSWLQYKKLRKQTHGLMSAVGEDWHRYRSHFSKRLMKPKVVAEYVDGINDVVKSFIQHIQYVRDNHGDGKTVPNLPNELCKWATESVSAVLFESRLGCLEQEMDERVQDFIKAVADMFLTGHQLIVFTELQERLGTKPWKRHVEAWDTIYEIAEDIINKKIEEMRRIQETEGDPNGGSAFLGHLIGNSNLSKEEIYTNTTEVLLAGLDTSSNALGFALYLLARNPRVQDRLRREVQNVCQDRLCSAADLQKLSYVKAIVKETLRLYPVLPINARVLKNDTMMDGYLIPKNTCVLLNAYTMGRNEKYFESPDEFMPERWLRSESSDWNPFATLPFGFGSRMCVGRRLAEQQLYLALIGITQKFQLNYATTYELKTDLRTVLSLGEQIPVEFIDL